MPWTVKDVDRFKKGLTTEQKKQWVKIANSVLEKCRSEGGTNCEALAIRQASGSVGNVSMGDNIVDNALSHNSKLADNEPSWGDVDKTKLPRNAFADRGEAGKKSTWGYPHHWVKNGEVGEDGIYKSGDMYLHKEGLNVAWRAAHGARSGQTADSKVIEHLKKHRKALNINNFQTINSNQSIANITKRYETYEGRDHLVVPAVILAEGVHNDLYYPSDELSRFVDAWNGIPVPVQHPERDGMPIPANSPDVLETQAIGRFFNAEFDENKLKGEIWIDIEKAKKIAPEILDIIQSDGKLEVSTGLFLDEDFIPGVWNDETYEATVRNYRPDHVALLPGSVGACSWDDGCGIRDNNMEGGDNDLDESIETIDQLKDEDVLKDKGKKFAIFSKIAKAFGFKAQELSHDELRSKLQRAIDTLDEPARTASGKYHYVREVFDDYLIMEVHTEGEEPKLFKQEYSIDDNEQVQLKGEPKEVRQEVSYTALKQKTEEDLHQNDADDKTDTKEDDNMCCEEKVKALIDNEMTNFTDDDRDWLMTMEEEQLDKLFPAEKEDSTDNNDDVSNNEDTSNVDDGDSDDGDEPITIEKILENSGEHKEAIEMGLKMLREKKTTMIKMILDNENNQYSEDELKSKTFDELEKLSALAKKDDADYTGRAGGDNSNEFKENERQEDGTGVPEPPVPQWNEDGRPNYNHLKVAK